MNGSLSGGAGLLIINADDWGRDRPNTDRTLECFLCGAVSSVSAMVFMEDSERAAAIALERGIDAGLHLNFTTHFSGCHISTRLLNHHERVGRYLTSRRLAQAVFHPGLSQSFDYLMKTQREEFSRLYGVEPGRIDGHHHMHLSANILIQALLPSGTRVRRNFSFQAGEKSFVNRWYRRVVDAHLARHHVLTDYFFALLPVELPRLKRILLLSSESTVELETHPIIPEEYHFLADRKIFRMAGEDVPFAGRITDQFPERLR